VVNAAEEQGVKTAARTRRAAVPIALVREVDTSWGVLERDDERRGRRWWHRQAKVEAVAAVKPTSTTSPEHGLGREC
jgi:hypothetical protein